MSRPYVARQIILDAMSEAQMQDLIIDTAKRHGWLVHHDQANVPVIRADGSIQRRTVSNGDTGFPDLVLARQGEVIIVECKAAKHRWRPGQREWLAATGGHVVTPATVDSLLSRLMRPRRG